MVYFSLKQCNGVSLLPERFWVTDPLDFLVDACDTGCGGFYFSTYFHVELRPDFVLTLEHIISKELFAVLLTCVLWKEYFARKRLVFNSDNITVVSEINHGHSKNKQRQHILREIWFISSYYHFELKARHVPGEANFMSDHLSRWHLDPAYRKEFFEITYKRYTELKEFLYELDNFSFTSPW